MKARGSVTFALGVVTAITLGGTVAYAANGGEFYIGRSNSETAPTRLTNPDGTALVLSSKPGSSPLAVNRRVKVSNLNADLLDGVDSLGFALRTGQTGIIEGSPTDGDHTQFTAVCPKGTIATGGGGTDTTTGNHLIYSGPAFNNSTGKLVPNSWEALSDASPIAFVVCYNPRGAVPGAAKSLATVGKGRIGQLSAAARHATQPAGDAP